MSAEQHLAPWPTLLPSLQLFMLSEGLVISTKISLAADLLADGPRSSKELALTTATHHRALYRVLRLLSMIGVFTEFSQTTLTLPRLVSFCGVICLTR